MEKDENYLEVTALNGEKIQINKNEEAIRRACERLGISTMRHGETAIAISSQGFTLITIIGASPCHNRNEKCPDACPFKNGLPTIWVCADITKGMAVLLHPEDNFEIFPLH